VPTAQRGALLDRFREDDTVQVFISTDAGGVGLNLQSGSVLINLDVPWNPAVLEQRNARIHRLGQTRKVQIITMVAADSYEERVFSLVKNKQHLFDNVIGEDATEDVVGVSRKLLETLVEELNAKTAHPDGATPVTAIEQLEVPVTASFDQQRGEAAKDEVIEELLAQVVTELQQIFGARIERILGAGGGLLVVLDRVDAQADQVAERLSAQVPVALLDQLSLNGLQRLGAGSPLAQARTHFAATDRTPEGSSRLTRLAAEKIQAAQLLLAQKLVGSALDLAVAALLAAAAGRAGRETPISLQDAGVWVYSEALPKGLLDQQAAGLIMRGVALVQGQAVPEPLVIELADEVARFVSG